MDDGAVNHFLYELPERGGGVRMKRAHFEGRGLLKLELDCRSRRLDKAMKFRQGKKRVQELAQEL